MDVEILLEPTSPPSPTTPEIKCGGCRLSLESESGSVVVAFGDGIWHVDCFKCAKCGEKVSADTNLLLLSDGSPVCGACSYNCDVCKLPILDEAIMTGDVSYHTACFKCKQCHLRIDDLVFAKTSQGIYCMKCHNERVARSRQFQERKKAREKKAREEKKKETEERERALAKLVNQKQEQDTEPPEGPLTPSNSSYPTPTSSTANLVDGQPQLSPPTEDVAATQANAPISPETPRTPRTLTSPVSPTQDEVLRSREELRDNHPDTTTAPNRPAVTYHDTGQQESPMGLRGEMSSWPSQHHRSQQSNDTTHRRDYNDHSPTQGGNFKTIGNGMLTILGRLKTPPQQPNPSEQQSRSMGRQDATMRPPPPGRFGELYAASAPSSPVAVPPHPAASRTFSDRYVPAGTYNSAEWQAGSGGESSSSVDQFLMPPSPVRGTGAGVGAGVAGGTNKPRSGFLRLFSRDKGEKTKKNDEKLGYGTNLGQSGAYSTTSQQFPKAAALRPTVSANDLLRGMDNVRLESSPQDSYSGGNPILAPEVEWRQFDWSTDENEASQLRAIEEKQRPRVEQSRTSVPEDIVAPDGIEHVVVVPSEGEYEDTRKTDQDYTSPFSLSQYIVPTLEDLMAEHQPLDLTDQVQIPDYRNPAQGGMADVYAGLWDDRRVAVKVLRFRRSQQRDASWEASHLRRLTREMNVWAALKHANICEFLGFASNFSDYPAMISTWCQEGTASEYLSNQTLSVMQRLKLAQDVVRGIQYLHQLRIIHGDLKPSNVLVSDDGVAQLCDFGLVRIADWQGGCGMTTTTPYTGTVRYKAPELFETKENRHPVATFEGDIFSLGCVMLQFIEQVEPFRRFKTAWEERTAITDGESPALRSETTHALSESTEIFWDLLEACWGKHSHRPDIATVDICMDELLSLTGRR